MTFHAAPGVVRYVKDRLTLHGLQGHERENAPVGSAGGLMKEKIHEHQGDAP